jgi:hypothetical protein
MWPHLSGAKCFACGAHDESEVSAPAADGLSEPDIIIERSALTNTFSAGLGIYSRLNLNPTRPVNS